VQGKGLPVSDHALSTAVIGLGNWGKNVLAAFSRASNCEVSWVCDVEPRLLEAASRICPAARQTHDYRDVLADPTVHAVAVVTPAPSHFEVARDALRAGKHVFVEKPLALTTADAAELEQIAARAGRKLMVGHLLKHHPAVEWMKQTIDSGELGDVHYMYCQRQNLGVVRRNENSFWSLAPHDISIILHLFQQEPNRVTASGASFLQPGIEDVVFATLHFPDGRIAQIHVSWLDPHKTRKMVVVGSQKMLVFDDMEPSEKIRVYDKGADLQMTGASAIGAISVRHGDISIPHIGNRAPLDAEIQHFVDCVLYDRPVLSDGADGVRVVRVLEEVEQQLSGFRKGRVSVAARPWTRAA